MTVSVGAGSDAATEGTDYAQVADFAITVAGGATTAEGSFTLTPTNDDVDENTGEAIGVTGTSGPLTVTGTTLTLTDDDARGVTVSPAAVTVRETDDAGTADTAEHRATYEVVLDSEPSGGTVTVNVASGATGAATVSPPSLAFDATDWSTPQMVTVTGVNDDVDNAGNQRTASITHTLSASGTDYSTVTASPVTVTVTDDDDAPGGITLSLDVTTVAENVVTAETVTVTATVTGGTAYAEDQVVAVTVGKAGDGAVSDTDYAAVTGFDITIPAQAMSATGSFDLDPTDDELDEADETVTVAGMLSGVTVTGTSLSITDDDPLPVLSIDAPTVTEGNTGTTATLRYTVTLNPVSGRAVTVAYADRGTGSATSGTDYTAVTAGTLSFAAGDASRMIDVTVRGDAADEDHETVLLRLSSASNATLTGGGASLDATGTITDDDAAPTVSVADAADVAEGNDPSATTDMSFTVTLSSASGRTVSVPYTLGGTAKAGEDYTGTASRTLTVAAGSASGDIVVAVRGDVVDEPEETVTVTLGVPVNATVSSAQGAGAATGKITDDDATPVATLTLAPSTIDESGAGNVSTVTAALSGASSEAVTLTVSATGAAHTLSTNKTLTVAAGETASTGTVTVTATDNAVDAAADATVTVSATASGGSVADPADVTLTVTDDDVRAVTVSKPTLTVREADNTGTADTAEHQATYTVVLASEPSGGTVTVNVASGATGTATVSPPSLEFDATNWSTPQEVTVTGVNDDVDNAGDQRTATVTHTVSAAATDYASVTASAVTVTVTDDDGPPTGIRLTVDVPSVAEDAVAAATITVTAAVAGGSAFDAQRTVVVSVGEATDTATEGTDYATVANFDIVIPKGAKSATGNFSLAPTDDDVDEGTGETVGVAGTSGSLPVTPATVTITDDDTRGVTVTPVTLTLDEVDNAATQNATENAGEYTVKLNSQPTANVLIDPSAGNGAPVTLDSTRLTFTPSDWNEAQTVTVTAVDDDFDNPGDQRTASITHTVTAGTSDYGSVSAAPVSVTVTDDDTAVSAATLTVDKASVAEDAAATEVTVTATLAGTTRYAAEQKVRVTVGKAGDAAVSGTDYAPVTAFDITIAKGQASGSRAFTLTPTDDRLDETDEALTLSGVLAGVTVSDAAVTITDDDDAPGGIVLSVSPGTVAEDATGAVSVAVTATVTGGTAYTVDQVVAVTVGKPTDGAVSGTDYVAVPGFNITVPAEDMTATESFDLNPTDDNLDEDDERVTVAGSLSGVTVTGTSLSITDDDPRPVLSIDAPTVTEGNAGTTTLRYTVTLNPASGRSVTVAYADPRTGTATSATDYTAVTAGTLTFQAGEVRKTLNVAVRGDAADEDHETVVLRLSSASNATLTGGGASLDGTGTITDDDAAPTVSVADAAAVAEGDDPATTTDMSFTVTLSAASGRTVSVPYTLGGTAQAGADYRGGTSGTLTVAAGSASGDIVVAVRGDVVDEPNETVTVTLGTPTNATVSSAPGAGTAAGEITDDDGTPVATLTLTPSTIGESGAGNVSTVTAALSGASSEAVTLTVSTTGAAHTLSANKTLTIAAGETASTGTVTVTATDNDVDAADAAVTVSASASGGGIAAPADAALTVRDDDARGVTVSRAAVTVREADDTGTTGTAEHRATYTVVLRSEPAGGTVTVNVASGAAGTATVSPPSLAFTATDWSTPQTVTVTGVNDDVHNAGGQRTTSVVHTVSAAGTDYSGETAAPVSVTVNDDDGPPTGINLSASVTTVAESAGAVAVTVTATVTGGSTYSGVQAVRVSIGNSGDSATEGADYAQVGDLTITVPAHARSATGAFSLDPTEDVIHEGTETLSLRGESSGITVNATSITITDNDAAPSGIALSADPGSIAENVRSQAVQVTATVTGGTTYASATEVSVSVGDSADSAVAGTDYRAVGGFTVTVPAGAASATGSFDLRPIDDSRDEEDKTISLAGASGNLTVTGATLGLTDDDNPPVLSISADDVAEGAGGAITRMRFTVRLSAASDKPVTVDYADTASGSATSGIDYQAAASGTLSFAPGDTERTIDVRVLADSDDEGEETIVLRLSSPGNATLRGGGASLDATGTIVDGPKLNISTANPLYVPEGHPVTFTITAERPPASDLRVNLWVIDRADLLEPEYEGNQQVRLGAGETSTTYRLVIARDNVDEPKGNVVVELRRGRGYQLGERQLAFVQVDDDLPPVEAAPGPVIGVAGGDAPVEGGTARFTLRADPAPEAVLSLNLAVSQQGVFVPASGIGDRRISFPAGETTHTYELATENDGDDEPDGAVRLTLAAGAGYRIDPGANSASLTVADNDATLISLSRSGAGAIPENGGTGDIRVTLGRQLQPGEQATVPLDIGGATHGDHYRLALVSAGQGISLLVSSPHSEQNPALRFLGPSGREATLRITAVANSDEAARTLELDYGTGNRAPSAVGLSGGLTATGGGISVPIADDDSELSIAPARAAEGSALGFVVRLPEPAPVGGVTIGYETLDGSGDNGDAINQVAVSGEDYQGVAGGASITIPTGRNTGSISIATINDDIYEGDHYFRVRLTQASHFGLGSVDTAVGTIDDGSDRPAFAFTDALFDVGEGDGAATLTVERHGDSEASATVRYTTSAGGAEAGSDYVSVRGELAFEPGDSALSFEVPIVDDGLDEMSEDFRATITTDGHGIPGARAEVEVRIVDNDATMVTVSFGAGASSEIMEGTGANEIVVSLSRHLQEGEVLAVPLLFGGAAELGVDYTLSAPAPWPSGVSYSNLGGGQGGVQSGPVRANVQTGPFAASSEDGRTSNPPTITFTGGEGSADKASLVVTAMSDAATDERPESVVIEIAEIGSDAAWNLDGGADGEGKVNFEIANFDQFAPTVSLAAGQEEVTEGEEIVLTVAAVFPEGAATDASTEVYVALVGIGEFWPAGSDVNTESSAYRTPVLSIGQPTATIRIATDDDRVKEADGELAAVVNSSEGYHEAEREPGDSSNWVRVRIRDNDDDAAPVVTLSSEPEVTEGGEAVFTVHVSPPQPADLDVNLYLDINDAQIDEGQPDGATTLRIAAGEASAELRIRILDDVEQEPRGRLKAGVLAGDTYRIGSPSSAHIQVQDDDTPTLLVADARVQEAPGAELRFEVTLTHAAPVEVTVDFATHDATATAGSDFDAVQGTLRFAPGETARAVTVTVHDDGHDEGEESVELWFDNLAGARFDSGYREVAFGVIVNSDPMPKAWLARFGRSVAEQVVEGVSDRWQQQRAPGFEGRFAGAPLGGSAVARQGADDAPDEPGRTFDDTSFGLHGSGAVAGPGAAGCPGTGLGGGLGGGPGGGLGGGLHSGPGGVAAPGSGTGGAGPGGSVYGGGGVGAAGALGSGRQGAGFGGGCQGGGLSGAGTHYQDGRSPLRDLLMQSEFTLTRWLDDEDEEAGTYAFWGRAAESRFDGNADQATLSGQVVTGMTGMDFSRGNWLAGLALAYSEGDGSYALAEGKGGEVDTSFTALTPYGHMQIDDSLSVWGVVGLGRGTLTLRPQDDPALRTDLGWQMAAVGARDELIALPVAGGLTIAAKSDLLWARTTSEAVQGLAGAAAGVTRFRAGLEGAWNLTLGGSLIAPSLEAGLRYDGGDAETGWGIDLGGGLAWQYPAWGIDFSIEGRGLATHEDSSFSNLGYSASFAFDPRPASEHGLSFQLRQDFGGTSSGGVESLFSTGAPSGIQGAGSGFADRRWTAEASWGLPTFRKRFTGVPFLSRSWSGSGRDTSLGWRMKPLDADSFDLFLDLEAILREVPDGPAESGIGLELRATW